MSKTSNNEKLILGLFVGLFVGVPITIYSLEYFSNKLTTILLVYLTALLLAAIITFLVVFFRKNILKSVFGIVKTDLKKITDTGIKLGDSISQGNRKESIANSKLLITEFSGWYAWVSFRNWSIKTLITIIIAFAGFIGTMLVFRQNLLIEEQKELLKAQNELLNTQNEKIQVQISLEEANRRSNSIVEISEIFNSIYEENRSQKNIKISPIVLNRIIALSHTLKPYKFID